MSRPATSKAPPQEFRPSAFQALCHTLVSPLKRWAIQGLGRDRLEYLCSNTMNAVTQRSAPFFWTYELKARVLRRRRENASVMSFELLPNQHWQMPQAGQYIELSFDVDGQIYERAYSISELTDTSFWITVKALPQGKISNALHQRLQVGDIVSLRGPRGRFVYGGQEAITVLCAGSGVTPCFALVQALLQRSPAQRPRIHVYAQFSRPEEAIFVARMQAWKNTGVQLNIAYSQQPEAGSSPVLNGDNFSQLFPELTASSTHGVYLCGPNGFQQGVMRALEAQHFPLRQLWIENFRPPHSEIHSEAQGTLACVDFSPYHRQIQMRAEDRHKTLLELGLEHGLDLEKGCRRGICGSCKLVLHAGEVRGQTLGKVVYLCRAYACSEKVVLGY